MKKKSTDTVVARWLLNAAKGKKRYVGILSLVCMISGTASMGYAVLLSGLVDSAIAGQTSAFFRYVILLLSLVALQFTLQCIIRFMEEYTRATLENAFKKRLFANILKKDYASVTATHSGEWLHRLTSDVSIVSANVTSILPGVAGTVSRLVASVVLLLTYAPDFTIIFCGGAVVLVFATWGLRKIIKTEKYLKLFCEKTDTARQYVNAWMPIVAASQSVKGNPEEREFLLNWANVCDWQ